MKTIKLLTLLTLFISLTSCKDDDDNPPLLDIESKTISNLYAPSSGGRGEPVSGDFVKFDFSTGEITTNDTEWDIAFRGTSIIINGGVSLGTTDEPERTGKGAAYIATGALSTTINIDETLFNEDTSDGTAIPSGSGNGWYIYAGPPTHLISPTPGKILIIKTRDGKYAKIEILSYYENAPEKPGAEDKTPYYTFNYVYQPNEGETTL